jgi:hypothetical protein
MTTRLQARIERSGTLVLALPQLHPVLDELDAGTLENLLERLEVSFARR